MEGLGVLCLSSHLTGKAKHEKGHWVSGDRNKNPWDGQGQTEADNEATLFPARNIFPKLHIAGCLLSCHLVSHVILGVLCHQAQSSPHKEPFSCNPPPRPPPLLSIL